MFPEIILTVVIAAFVLEFFDSAVGMGFGTLTPVLILLGFAPLAVVPAVLFCSAALSLSSGIMHHGMKNFDFFRKENRKIFCIFLGFGLVAIILGAFIAVNIPEYALDIYIGLLTLAIGLIILKKFKMRRKVSLKRITAFATLASANKGITGGGFGPVLSGGQIISGIKSKRAVGMTQITEGTLSIIGVLAHMVFQPGQTLEWSIIVSMLLGGILSVPIAVYLVRRIDSRKIRLTMGLVSIVLGIAVILKVILARF
ncbi:TSUP family transporter [Candidatus Woesearchaeota archaeon]|nr:TSUP family transporter [Candidatus Woesearchaeota archaeon]